MLANSVSGGALPAMAPMPAPMPMLGDGESSMKRMRDSPVSSGDPLKDSLVQRVKNFQRIGNDQKELWAMYADTYLGGARDPARHETATLHEFCVNHHVPELGPGGGMPMGMGGGGDYRNNPLPALTPEHAA